MTNGAQLYFRQTGVSTVFVNTGAITPEAPMSPQENVPPVVHQCLSPSVEMYRVDMDFSGCNPVARISADGELSGVSNYYLAHCPRGITGVKRFARIIYEDLYAHIDLEYLYDRGRLKYNFIVHPGGSVEDIRMRYTGAVSVRVTNDGTLKATSPIGICEDEKPLTYQNGVEVSSAFTMQGDEVSIHVGEYDRTQNLVIDPWATYFGGNSWEYWTGGIATDAGGNVVITGGTSSTNFPVTAGAFQSSNAGPSHHDAFVVKFDSTGSVLWATYYGGSINDWANAVATDGNGNMVITGDAGSSNFPVTNASTHTGGGFDAFIVAFDASGTRLWATYYGGSGNDNGKGIASDGYGNVFITGQTSSTDIPVTNASTNAGGLDGFVAAFSGSGSALWATYYGGGSDDDALGIATDGSGHAIITGFTKSTNLPVTNASTHAGGVNDAFVANFSGGGSVLWATYYGGSGSDVASAVVTDGSANIFISGGTSSTDLPCDTSSSYAGAGDAFIATFNGSGTIQRAIYYGGSGGEAAKGIAVDGSGNPAIAGSTTSTDLPVTNSSVHAGGQEDVFVAKFDGSGTRTWGTYYGGNNIDRAYGVAADRNGNTIITGTTLSPNLPVTNASVKAASTDLFIVHFDASGTFPVELVSITAEHTPAGTVLIRWTTTSESDNAGFEMQSRCGPGWQSRTFVPGHGTTILPQSYEWIDEEPPCRIVWYRLRQVDFDGTSHYSLVVEAFPAAAQRDVAIRAIAPQPATSAVVVHFSLANEDVVSFTLYDALGRSVATLQGGTPYGAGMHAVALRLGEVAAGTYILRAAATRASAAMKIHVR